MPPPQGGAADRSAAAFPTKQLTILAICRFSEPIAFNSILAYTYVMVQDLNGGSDADASFWAGLLVSAYAVAEAMTAMGWGALSDRYGRKPVVLIGLGGVAVSSLIFGLAKTYWVALLARFVGGALNGNVAVMQTMVAEMVKVPEHEPKAYATQPFVWTLGGIIGSAMGGFLAQPARFYPHVFPEDGLFGRYPYLLPNLVSVVAIVLAIVQGVLFLEETNPAMRRRRASNGGGSSSSSNKPMPAVQYDAVAVADDDDDIDETTPLRRGGGRLTTTTMARERPAFAEESLPLPVEQTFDLRRSSFGTVHSIRVTGGEVVVGGKGTTLPPQQQAHAIQNGNEEQAQEQEEDAEYTGRTFNFTIVMLTVALVLFSYHQMAFCTLLPTHLLDRPAGAGTEGGLDLWGGLGYTVHDVGVYLAVNGVLGLFIQGVIFPVFVERVGVWRSFVWMVVLYPACYVVMPFLTAVPEGLRPSGIYLAMALQSFFGIVVSPCALILLKDATPSSRVLGRVNGLAMSACCLARTVSPPLVGIIYSTAGSAAAWFSCAGVAVLGTAQLFWVPRKHVHDVVVVDTSLLGKTISNSDGDVNGGGEHAC
ncbi:MFS general substrate transporter [Biscogniauxia mediterranea]|nr:MFS general substrate transporter [Biscogniauxia mediterranea]